MEIYIARICERTDGTMFAERKKSITTEARYVVISHVWGNPSTIQSVHIDGIGPVMLSPEKQNLLSILRRDDICGTRWFWLDLFCINQKDDSPISILDQLMAVPSIYKSAKTVIVLIESPICKHWLSQASYAAWEGIIDTEVFEEEEAHHARKCPHLPFMDSWFDRLWTRQEGLYAMKLKVKILNPVPCLRLSTSVTAMDRWIRQGEAAQERVMDLIADKLAYHNIKADARMTFKFYIGLLYSLRIKVSDYGGIIGPQSDYSPIRQS
ncbi:hypothetical protein PT974_01702 [Cladobotryum mycophilum]|uniref:Heterokaryon incompatibility domain-containing protein n=1 Tax=Cladobotryum mycophilum TaxID=491253 RepID=A0ABR0SW34_9HYPO